jgi:hypothetical protein
LLDVPVDGRRHRWQVDGQSQVREDSSQHLRLGDEGGGNVAPHLLEGAVDWLWAQRLPEAREGLFAMIAEGPSSDEPSRLAWCYGDAGIAGALCAAADLLDHARLREMARVVGRRAAAREESTARVVDGGLCHGTAGLGHGFNRLYQATGEEIFLEAARTWFARTFEQHRPGAGFGGYLTWAMVGAEGQFAWRADAGLLTGATGIAAALLAATTSVSPEWDRFLLLSLPAPRE